MSHYLEKNAETKIGTGIKQGFCPKPERREDADYSRQHLLDQDYEPCGLCRP